MAELVLRQINAQGLKPPTILRLRIRFGNEDAALTGAIGSPPDLILKRAINPINPMRRVSIDVGGYLFLCQQNQELFRSSDHISIDQPIVGKRTTFIRTGADAASFTYAFSLIYDVVIETGLQSQPPEDDAAGADVESLVLVQ